MISYLTDCCVVLFLYANLWYFISVYKKRNDIADIAWGIAYIVVCLFIFFKYETGFYFKLLFLLISLWGVRLSLHIFIRNKDKKEDFRYNAWRQDWGKWFYIRSYFQVYILQASIALVIMLPILYSVDVKAEFSITSCFGILIWISGFSIQSLADYQLLKFVKTEKKKKGEFLQSGLWKYSRHPNYFGEIVMWWAICLILLPVSTHWIIFISPITITLLLIFVSGIPMLEKRYQGNEKFQEYKKRTSVLIPLPQKN